LKKVLRFFYVFVLIVTCLILQTILMWIYQTVNKYLKKKHFPNAHRYNRRRFMRSLWAISYLITISNKLTCCFISDKAYYNCQKLIILSDR
jgi:hypothetical protein